MQGVAHHQRVCPFQLQPSCCWRQQAKARAVAGCTWCCSSYHRRSARLPSICCFFVRSTHFIVVRCRGSYDSCLADLRSTLPCGCPGCSCCRSPDAPQVYQAVRGAGREPHQQQGGHCACCYGSLELVGGLGLAVLRLLWVECASPGPLNLLLEPFPAETLPSSFTKSHLSQQISEEAVLQNLLKVRGRH